ncbi:arylamine N-acetyltransferase [Nocardiopsis sp. YSL2]|uniref:arylamine N-acetyltransferase family protein n=1 Tax=Nocardiopsis sp. YSL2 TaxID=2939492 RepID=UPI0026F46ADD|nr:arylamine N-acetyltransferase [Nocardiopsis sp. YSL2]
MSIERDALAPLPGRIVTERDFWRGGDLDLDAYLDRVGLRGADLPPTLDTLRAVHRAHLAHIPFENLQLVLDRPVLLDVPALTDKMVHRRRGGYCYEQNLLLAAVLDRLGFVFTALAARVVIGAEGHPRPSTHAVLLVELDGRRWMADVGFGGGGLLEPFPLADGHQEERGGWGLRLDRVDDVGPDEWLLRSFDGRTWRDMYMFATAAMLPQDYAIFSHFLTTHPRSPFRGRLMAQRMAPHAQSLLTNTALVTKHPDGTHEEREIAIEDVPDVLDGVFGIGLTEQERGVVVDRLKDFTSM